MIAGPQALQVHGLQALTLYLFGEENFGEMVGRTHFFDARLEYSAENFHGLEHVG